MEDKRNWKKARQLVKDIWFTDINEKCLSYFTEQPDFMPSSIVRYKDGTVKAVSLGTEKDCTECWFGSELEKDGTEKNIYLCVYPEKSDKIKSGKFLYDLPSWTSSELVDSLEKTKPASPNLADSYRAMFTVCYVVRKSGYYGECRYTVLGKTEETSDKASYLYIVQDIFKRADVTINIVEDWNDSKSSFEIDRVENFLIPDPVFDLIENCINSYIEKDLSAGRYIRLGKRLAELRMYEESEAAKSKTDIEWIKKELGENNSCLYKNIWFSWKKYQKNSSNIKIPIPNFAIMGAPGVGKTKLAESLSELFEGEIHKFSASDLKGAYVGQTGATIYDMFLKVLGLELAVGSYKDKETGNTRDGLYLKPNNPDGVKRKKIIFIDEIYTLMNDNFGREAVSILLPIMSGDRRIVSCSMLYRCHDGSDNPRPDICLDDYEGVSIWIAGYEGATRRMLQTNQGLYRRFEKLSLKTPSVDRLMEVLKERLSQSKISIGEEENPVVKNFFGWATSPEHSLFFANYSGVMSFAEKYTVLCESPETGSNKGNAEIVAGIMKKEIEEQYQTVISTTDECLKKEILEEIGEFRVSGDIPDTKVVGYEDVVRRVNEFVEMLFNKKDYLDKGIKIINGALFVGPPGTGKSYFAKYMAYMIQKRYRDLDDKDHRVGFIAVSSTDICTPEKVSKLFSEAKKFDDCIIFIDEIDFIAEKREQNRFAPALSKLMTEMDGFGSDNSIFILAATNTPERIDPALKRPGRFDRIIEIDLPDVKDRQKLLEFYLKNTELKEDIIEEVAKDAAKITRGFSASELKQIVNEALISINSDMFNRMFLVEKDIIPKDENVVKMLSEEIREQVDKMIAGDKENRDENKNEREVNEGPYATAVHEIGHAIMSILESDEKEEPFDEITIIPRKKFEGFVRRFPKTSFTKKRMLSDIRVCFGGKVAEELVYGDDNVSGGAVSDILQATSIASNMVLRYGISYTSKEASRALPIITPRALVKLETGYMSDTCTPLCSESTKAKADDLIDELLRKEYLNTRKLLSDKLDTIRKLADIVCTKEKMSGSEFLREYNKV
ncbi:MAG: AAA family ATPase [Lachnospiraceae bacterium]|nr:AAA family ATPase [Lachnospiraceae bacterium]